MKLLDGKTALVTGAGSGFGKAMSLLYAEEGAKIIVSDISIENGEETVHEIKQKGGEAIFIEADVSRPEDNERIVKEATKAFGSLDIAFNNAGIGGASALIGDYPIEDWDRIIKINLSSVFYGMHYQIP